MKLAIFFVHLKQNVVAVASKITIQKQKVNKILIHIFFRVEKHKCILRGLTPKCLNKIITFCLHSEKKLMPAINFRLLSVYVSLKLFQQFSTSRMKDFLSLYSLDKIIRPDFC